MSVFNSTSNRFKQMFSLLDNMHPCNTRGRLFRKVLSKQANASSTAPITTLLQPLFCSFCDMYPLRVTEAYLGSYQIFLMELFAEIVNVFQPIGIYARKHHHRYLADVSKYASEAKGHFHRSTTKGRQIDPKSVTKIFLKDPFLY